MNSSDEQLMQRVQQGELSLFNDLAARHRPALLRVADSKLGELNAAEDVVQETLLAAFAARHTYNPSFSFRTWVWTILLNLCRRHYRRRRRVAAAPTGDGLFRAVEPASTETGLSAALKSERREQLHRALEHLSEVQADALRLRFFAELKYDEIAQAMGCSLGTAKMRVRNGLARLARDLQERGDA